MNNVCFFNFKTGKTEYFDSLPIDRIFEFMPQKEELIGLYNCYISEGFDPIASREKAMKEYLNIHAVCDNQFFQSVENFYNGED